MIISFFLYVFYQIIAGILSILPEGLLNSNVSDSFTTLWGYLAKINSWIPLTTLWQVLGIFFATELIIFSVRAGVFFYNKVRGSG